MACETSAELCFGFIDTRGQYFEFKELEAAGDWPD